MDWSGSEFFKKNFLYWNIVDLQCCVSSRYTAKWISFIFNIYSLICLDSFPMEVRVWSRVPCTTQQVLIRHLFCIERCVYVSPNLCQHLLDTQFFFHLGVLSRVSSHLLPSPWISTLSLAWAISSPNPKCLRLPAAKRIKSKVQFSIQSAIINSNLRPSSWTSLWTKYNSIPPHTRLPFLPSRSLDFHAVVAPCLRN